MPWCSALLTPISETPALSDQPYLIELSVDESLPAELSDEEHLTRLRDWAIHCLKETQRGGEVNIRLCDSAEMQACNLQFAGNDYATNVLSFPAGDMLTEMATPLLGDILICIPVVQREALEQKKDFDQHLAHMLCHGVLHLLGYDHVVDEEAQAMEGQERRLLNQLGFPDPYRHIGH